MKVMYVFDKDEFETICVCMSDIIHRLKRAESDVALYDHRHALDSAEEIMGILNEADE